MRLYIAEKPDMGRKIAACLGGTQKKCDGYIETSEGIVTWAFGHILRLAEPQEYDPKYKTWAKELLPIIPTKWKLCVSASCEKQMQVIKGLVNKSTEIVHAGDPDREGQLLIDEILVYLNNTKPVRRLLLNALTDQKIKEALVNTKPNVEFSGLYDSALGRQRADWLIGMNITRLFTIEAQQQGYEGVFPIGRVKTPTLALVVRREEEIQKFISISHYKLNVMMTQNNYSFQWQPKETEEGLDSEGRLIKRSVAENLLDRIIQSGKAGRVTHVEFTKKSEAAPLPYSLTSLQVKAASKYGYSPDQVLATLQTLYERQFVTYPRSDCEYLPESLQKDIPKIAENLSKLPKYQMILGNADFGRKSRAWNDNKLSAHHGIWVTEVPFPFDKASEIEKNLYDLIVMSVLAQFYPDYKYDKISVAIELCEEAFSLSGRRTVVAGWKELYGKTEDSDEENDEKTEIPQWLKGEQLVFNKGEISDLKTKPPQRFTSGTLLDAMENIHRYVQDKELKEVLKEYSGIGTVATRATIIKDLIDRNFIVEKKGKLFPSEQGTFLIHSLPENLTMPDSTAKWEMDLAKVARKENKLDIFMNAQTESLKKMCIPGNIRVKQNPGVKKCPVCKEGVMRKRNGKNGEFWGCSRYPDCKSTMAQDDQDQNSKTTLGKTMKRQLHLPKHPTKPKKQK